MEGSKTRVARALPAASSMRSREVPDPISSSVVRSRPAVLLSDGRAEEGERRDRLDDAGLHVEDTGAAHLVTVDAPGKALECAAGPDGVEVAEKQDRGAVGPPA